MNAVLLTSSLKTLQQSLRNDEVALLQLLLALCNDNTFDRITNCPTYPVAAVTSDLDERLRLFDESLVGYRDNAATVLALLFESTIPEKQRKTHGQYFTPQWVARKAIDALAPTKGETILDVGCGTGIFAIAILQRILIESRKTFPIRYVGVENNHLLALSTAIALDFANAPNNWRVLYDNYLLLKRNDLTSYGISSVSGIISNPPFVRFHRIKDRDELTGILQKNTTLTLSKLSGLHSFFLAQSITLVPNRRMVFILPPEMNGVRHGLDVLDKLRQTHAWSTIQIQKNPNNPAPFLTLYNFVPRANHFDNEPHEDRLDDTLALRTIASIHRGLSTGANRFFVLTDDLVAKMSINPKFLRKVVPTRVHLPENTFSRDDWQGMRLAGKPCWLLAVRKNIPQKQLPIELRRYLLKGEKWGIPLTSTCQNRKPWFSVPVPEEAPEIIFTYMSRDRPRFLSNESGALILNNLLSLKWKPTTGVSSKNVRTTVEMLNESLLRWVKREEAGRIYSGGLLKFEPRDLENLPLPRNFVTRLLPSLESYT